MLLIVRQLFQSTKEGLPSCFLSLWALTEVSALFAPPILLWSGLLLFLSYSLDNSPFCDHPFCKPGITCSAGVKGIPLASVGCLFWNYDCWPPLVSGCSRKFLLMVWSWFPAAWIVCIPPAFPSIGCCNAGLSQPFPEACLVSPELQFSLLFGLEVHCRTGIKEPHLPILLWMPEC